MSISLDSINIAKDIEDVLSKLSVKKAQLKVVVQKEERIIKEEIDSFLEVIR